MRRSRNISAADDDGAEGRDYDWFYDAMGRLTETEWRAADQGVPFDYTLINKYDANSRRTERIVHVDPDDPYVPTDLLRDWWYYDDLGRVVTQDQRDNLFNWRRATYTYFADGQLDTMDRYTYDSPNWTKLLTTKWTYDGAGRIADLKHFKADGTTLLAGYGYGFDAAGRMTSMDFLNSTYNAEDVTTFGYDRTNQLLSGERSGTSNDEAYAYDGAGNRTSANGASYTTTANNRLTNDGTFTYTYDDEGNRLTKVRISGAAADDKTVEYQWDYRNRLEKVTFKRNDGTVTKRVENYYDMFNRWTKRVLDYDGDTGSATPRVDRMI